MHNILPTSVGTDDARTENNAPSGSHCHIREILIAWSQKNMFTSHPFISERFSIFFKTLVYYTLLLLIVV